jgi:hypothetical protein
MEHPSKEIEYLLLQASKEAAARQRERLRVLRTGRRQRRLSRG